MPDKNPTPLEIQDPTQGTYMLRLKADMMVDITWIPDDSAEQPARGLLPLSAFNPGVDAFNGDFEDCVDDCTDIGVHKLVCNLFCYLGGEIADLID